MCSLGWVAQDGWLGCVPEGWREQADADDPIEVVDGVKLCNNALTSVCGLGPALKPFLLCNLTTTLQWLDLSFNNIASLDGEALGELPNLAILNLHVNKLSTFGSVAGLAKLARLEKLTLHGNPLEEQKGTPPHEMRSLNDCTGNVELGGCCHKTAHACQRALM